MKKIVNIAISALLLAATFVGCNKPSDATATKGEYIMFYDTIHYGLVFENEEPIEIPVSSNIVCDYDRNFGVEIIDKGSTAIEGKHFNLGSNTITIKAGESVGYVDIKGKFDNLQESDSLGVKLRLIAPEAVKNQIYSDYQQISVVLYKSYPMDLNNFTGWCLVSSSFLLDYPGEGKFDHRRLIQTELHPLKPNTVILKNFMQDGYDINITLSADTPYTPDVSMEPNQPFGTSDESFGATYGDGLLRMSTTNGQKSMYTTGTSRVLLFTTVRMQNFDGSTDNLINGGYVGSYFNTLEWISDEMAALLQREEGL